MLNFNLKIRLNYENCNVGNSYFIEIYLKIIK